MESWSPATADEVAARIEKDLREAPAELAALFSKIRTPLRAVPITRFGNVEYVFIVAEKNGVAVYFEDVEEGFNLSVLAADGSIAKPGWETWKLHHALWHLEA